ncbi:MAG: hypothetical protein RBT64_03430 [Trichloromonas sp.]|jgi:hypothetical protein|nr:hypothetical protein [Trichloromonas sp.]
MSNSLYEQLTELEKDYVSLSSEYESNGSYEMAFISLWSILEHIMKPIATVSIMAKLKNSLNEWLVYVENPQSVTKPKEIKNFQLEYTNTTIPQIAQIEDAVGALPKLKVLMDSNNKYRKKRNSIAHRAEKLSDGVYAEYKNAVLGALDELKNTLAKFEKRT